MNKLPKVYVLGDSISMHYGPFLQSYLIGFMEYSRKQGEEETFLNLDNPQGANGGDSSMVLSFLNAKAYKGGIDADYMLLNCGLHDIKTNLRSGSKQVSLIQYENNLCDILRIIKSLRLKLIWVRTTQFDEKNHNRFNLGFHRFISDCIEYNNLADAVMSKHGIPIIDLCQFTLNLGNYLYSDHVHFTESVQRKQAAFVAGWLIGWITKNG